MKQVYLDGAANTPLDKRVYKAMKPYMKDSFMGNSFAAHDFGVAAYKAVEESRSTIASCLQVKPNEVHFTSGATESNNWVIKSLAFHELSRGLEGKKHIVVSAIEHASIIQACKDLEPFGFVIDYVQPNKLGRITSKAVQALLRKDTLLVCVMAVNNETGVVNPINAIGRKVARNGSLMLSDCTQRLSMGGKKMNLSSQYVHYMTFSGHKIYGPTGTGCLVAKDYVPLYRFISGGSQENGLRGGTSNVAGIVGLAKAISLMTEANYEPHFNNLYNYLITNIPYCVRQNVKPDHSNIVSLNFSTCFDVDNLTELFASYGIAVSAGSACDTSHDQTKGEFNPSHVLKAIGFTNDDIKNTVRVSFTKYTQVKDIERFIKVVNRLCRLAKDGKPIM